MHRLLTITLACLGMVGALAIDAYLPSIPAIGREFQVGDVAVQQTLSLFMFGFALMMLFYGTLSDSFGRRRVLLVSLALYAAASLAAAFSHSLAWLLACRVLQGLAAGSGSVLSAAIVQDMFSGAEAQRMMSRIMMVFGIAPAVAPVVGGWMHVTFGWRSVFFLLFAFAATMIVLVLRVLPETLPPDRRHAFHPVVIARNYVKVMALPRFSLLALTLGTAFAGLSLYIGSAAHFVIDILHKSETSFAWMFVPLIGGFVTGSAAAGKLSHAWTPQRMIWTGFALMSVSLLWNVTYNAVYVAAVPWAVLPLFVYTLGLALVMPAVQNEALGLFPDNRGLAASLQSFIQMMMFALVSGFAAPLLFDSAFKLACGMGACMLASFGFWRLSRRARSA
jgi:DHA1 family bicyclomycin/chloramphenicol resistance-like MFS transporter